MRFSVLLTLGAISANSPVLAIRATTRRVEVRKLKVTNTSGVLTQFALVGGASIATAGTPTLASSKSPQSHHQADSAATALVDTVWSVAPTLVATPTYLDGATLGAVAGNGQLLSWPDPDPLTLETAQQILLWNYGGFSSGTTEIVVTVDE